MQLKPHNYNLRKWKLSFNTFLEQSKHSTDNTLNSLNPETLVLRKTKLSEGKMLQWWNYSSIKIEMLYKINDIHEHPVHWDRTNLIEYLLCWTNKISLQKYGSYCWGGGDTWWIICCWPILEGKIQVVWSLVVFPSDIPREVVHEQNFRVGGPRPICGGEPGGKFLKPIWGGRIFGGGNICQGGPFIKGGGGGLPLIWSGKPPIGCWGPPIGAVSVNCICEWALGQEKTFQCKTAPNSQQAGVLQSLTMKFFESGSQCVKNLLATLSISGLGTCSSTHVQAENADQAWDCNIGSLYHDHRMKRPVKCVKNFTSVISFQNQNWKNQAEKDSIWTDEGWTNLESNDLIGLSSKEKILILFVHGWTLCKKHAYCHLLEKL